MNSMGNSLYPLAVVTTIHRFPNAVRRFVRARRFTAYVTQHQDTIRPHEALERHHSAGVGAREREVGRP
jgi:hypothetical protein